ncbi:MAG TPA: threonine/serine dehydratase [Candidatus Limnocylindrales bacterium]
MTAPPVPSLVSLADVRRAARRLRGVALRTPLLPFAPPTARGTAGGTDGTPPLEAWLKPESLQPIGAFKLRGAYNAIAALPAARRRRGVVTHSSGNHAQGVARAARLLAVPAVVVMPRTAPAVKVAGVRADGAEIVFVGPSSDERLEVAHRLAEERHLSLISSYDDAAVIAGQGTVGLELVEQVAELDRAAPTAAEPAALTVLVPIGGGGLASGVSLAVKALRPDARVYGVEPALAADARDSLREDRLVAWPPEAVSRTIADGQRLTSIGRLPFEHLRRFLDGVLAVEEDELKRAMFRAARDARLVLEPSGASTLAALLYRRAELPAAGRIVAVLSGGNVEPDRYREWLAEGEALEADATPTA